MAFDNTNRFLFSNFQKHSVLYNPYKTQAQLIDRFDRPALEKTRRQENDDQSPRAFFFLSFSRTGFFIAVMFSRITCRGQ